MNMLLPIGKTARQIEDTLLHCAGVENARVLIVISRHSGLDAPKMYRLFESSLPHFEKKFQVKMEAEDVQLSPGRTRFNLRVYPSERLVEVVIDKDAGPDALRGYEPSAVWLEDLVSDETRIQLGRRLGSDQNSRLFSE